MESSPLRRVYLFSDTYGRSKNPFDQDDADAHISTDFRSFPLAQKRREFDIYGRESVLGHILRLIMNLHEGVRESTYFSEETKKEFAQTITGVFINAAPRTNTHQNGAPFYVATAGNLRIVTTDLSVLSTIKHHIETLEILPNENNNLYGPTEQFRSSYTPRMLLPHHGLTLNKESIDLIPEYTDDRWELAYVDRFGNLMTYTKNVDKVWAEVENAAKQLGGEAKVIIGNVSQRVQITTSLRDAEPGALVMYPNGGNIDIVRKWVEGEDRFTRLYQSAYFQFSKGDIGAKVRIHISQEGA